MKCLQLGQQRAKKVFTLHNKMLVSVKPTIKHNITKQKTYPAQPSFHAGIFESHFVDLLHQLLHPVHE